MTPERWRVVKDVFDAAVQQDEFPRSTYLDRACGDDQSSAPRLRRCLRPTKARTGSWRMPFLG